MTARTPKTALDKYRSLRDNFELFSKHCLKIRTKSGEVKPFILNASQRYVHEKLEEQRLRTGRVRAIILKARQQGFSTYIGARFYHRVTHGKGKRCFILSHEQTASDELFSMVERYHNNIQLDMKPHTGVSNAKELYFDKLDSGYKVGTAGNKAVGRGSTVQYFHGSEVAFWSNDREHAAGVMQAIPEADDTEVVLESTGNGMANLFYEMSMAALRGESDFQLIFVPWFMSEEYRIVGADIELTEEEKELAKHHDLDTEQMAWRRKKISQLGIYKFMQEYPSTPQEAFQTTGEDTYIKPEEVMKARKRVGAAFGPIIMGVDPAGEGKDRTAFVWRQGEKMLAYEVHQNLDEMAIVGYIVNELQGQTDHAMIDGIGLGSGIISRLKELGFAGKIKNVKGSNKPENTQRFVNKRAECWGNMKDWLEEGSLMDDDNLHMDLTSLLWKYDSSGRVQLESKQDMRKRGISSPDIADALAYTFAYPVLPQSTERAKVIKEDLWS
jgi:hypothetical protein